MGKLTIVVPAFNEEAVLPSTIATLTKIEHDLIEQNQIAENSDILVVDDGSADGTWAAIEEQHRQQLSVKGLKFSRNFGHQNALLAGMQEAVKSAEMIVTIDADLQDDPNAIIEMVKDYHEGADIVYGVRNNRESDTWFKRTTANGFYKFLNLLGVRLIVNHADFRLMSQKAVVTLMQYQERNMFIRGVIPMLGFKTAKVYYKRTPRMAGDSKYPLKKMLAFAWEGITSLTIAPVRLILVLGILAFITGICMMFYALFAKYFGATVHGWTSLMISIWIVGGLQMISLGVVGEYIGKVTTEVKHRPRFTIEKVLE